MPSASMADGVGARRPLWSGKEVPTEAVARIGAAVAQLE
jgi:hypothetical protein